jgi:pimeloyl-ACP methyl ester carboxylesterase
MKKILATATLKRALILTTIFNCFLGPVFGQTKAGYAQVHGIKMYYEVHGAGKPIVLLHGAFSTINTTFGELMPALSKTRQVIAVELQGHGRTQDIDRPFSFESMADDVAAVLKFL